MKGLQLCLLSEVFFFFFLGGGGDLHDFLIRMICFWMCFFGIWFAGDSL